MAGFDTISAHELDFFYRKGNALIIDLRSREEFAQGHYRDAVNIPYEDLEEWENGQSEKLPKEKILVLYCDRGSASQCHLASQLNSPSLKNICFPLPYGVFASSHISLQAGTCLTVL